MRTQAFLIALSLLCGCAPPVGQDPASETAGPALIVQPNSVPWSGATRTYADELAASDRMVHALSRRVDAAPDTWIYREQLAGALLGRGRLTGDWANYAQAREQLDAAMTQPNAGPWGTLAALQDSTHQLDALGPSLDRLGQTFPRNTTTQADLAGRRGNLALLRGQYAEARLLLEQAVALHESPTSLSSLAVWFWRTGDLDAAEALFVRAASQYHSPAAEPRAWFHLNLGLLDLDRGAWADALAHYRDAERELSGYWLVDEHIAEVLEHLGRGAEAEALYRDIIERTDAPEFMDALCDLLAQRGQSEEAARWRFEARRRWEAALALFPEAAYGHALSHYLASDDGQERALELAQANHRLRPEGESKVSLARALLAVGRALESQQLIEEALASPFESADLHDAAAEVYEALGLAGQADAERSAARHLRPHGQG